MTVDQRQLDVDFAVDVTAAVVVMLLGNAERDLGLALFQLPHQLRSAAAATSLDLGRLVTGGFVVVLMLATLTCRFSVALFSVRRVVV